MTDLLVTCTDPKNRYKSAFSNKRIIRPNAFPIIEGFSHKECYSSTDSCVDVCNTAQPGTSIFETCRTGSLAFCNTLTNTNIDQCFADKCKYAELDTILNTWCNNNPNNVGYYKYCVDQPTDPETLKIIQALTTINPDFIYYVKPGVVAPTTAMTLYELMNAQPTLTVKQLEFLFNQCNDENAMTLASKKLNKTINELGGQSALLRIWQGLYAKAQNITPFDKPAANAFPGQNINLLFNTAVVLNGPSGNLLFIGDFDFPYKARILSYDITDKFWSQLLVSATTIKGKWSWNNLKTLSSDDIDVFKKDLSPITDIYEIYQIQITGLPTPVAATVITRTMNRTQFVNGMKQLMINKFSSHSSDIIESTKTDFCSKFADLCYDFDIATVKTQPFDTNSYTNTICDKAISNITGETDNAFYSQANAKTIKEACALSYANTTCKMPGNRYKSAFSNNSDVLSHKETYGGTGTCVDACSTAVAGTNLFESCRTGSLAACSTLTDTNIDQCFSDKCKYLELDTILNKWCDENKSNINYSKYCATGTLPSSTPSTSVDQQKLATADGTSKLLPDSIILNDKPVMLSPTEPTKTITKIEPIIKSEPETKALSTTNEPHKESDKFDWSTIIWIVIGMVAFLLISGVGLVVYKNLYMKSRAKRPSNYIRRLFSKK